MNQSSGVELMTTEQLLAMPDDGIDRELIDGELREKPMSLRSRHHSRTLIKSGKILDLWNDQRPPPRGEFVGGDAGFRLRRDPDTSVGIDLAYVSPEMVAQIPENQRFIEGVPLLAAEILSPSDTHEGVLAKIQVYLSAGVAVVWILDPNLQTITVHRPNCAPQMFTSGQEISGEPELPGFRAQIARFFE